MDISIEALTKIQNIYEDAWKAIQSTDYDKTVKILHKNMDVNLYDLSLDIEDGTKTLSINEDNEQLKIIFEETKHLIGKVNKKLAKYSTSEEDENSNLLGLQKDKFKKQF